MLRSNTILFICLFSFLVLTACSLNEDEKSTASDEESSKEQNAESEKGTGEPIKLYGNDFIEEIAPKFQEDTGYEIEGVHYGGGEALAQIEAEQGNPQWDVIMMDGHGSIRNLADRGFLLTDWEPENIDLLSEDGTELVPEDNAYTPIGVHASAVIVYNTDIVTEETAPKTWDEFFAYDGPVGHADPAVAAPAYPLVSSLFYKWGVEEGKERYLKRFEDGFNIYPKNGPVTSAVINGEIHVAALQEHNAYQAELDGENVGVIWPEEGAPGSVRVVAINKDSKNLEAAKVFVEYMLEPDTQKYLTSLEDDSSSFFTPLSKGAEMRKERKQNGTFLLPPAEWAAEHETEIKTWFADQNVN